MTKAQAVQLAQSRWWEGMAARDIAMFQLHEDLLCMDFGDFHAAVEVALGRPVWTHEFADVARLQRELLGDAPPPSFGEIVSLIPEHKRIVLMLDESKED